MANKKITELPASAGLALADLLPVVDDPAGTPATQKATFTQVRAIMVPIALGTEVSGTLPFGNGGTGSTSIASGIVTSNGTALSSFAPGANVQTFLTTPSSANLASAVTDETGSGALVFANTPTLVTPNIGAATGTSLVLSSTLSVGGSPVASVGAIRLPNAQDIWFRNAANDGDVQGLVCTGLNRLLMGGSTAADVELNAGTGTFTLKVASAAATATFDSTSLTLPNSLWLSDGSGDYFKFATSSIAASRTITLPALTGNDTFVFEAHTQTLTNKTISWTSNTNTFTSAEARTACSDETGTGSLVFANTPTLVTPVIGAATGTSLAVSSFLSSSTGSAADTGVVRVGNHADSQIVALGSGGGTNKVYIATVSNADNMYIGANTAQSTGALGSVLYFAGGGAVHQKLVGGVEKMTIAANGTQFGGGAQDFGGGVGVLGIDNAGTNPSTNPTGGGILYSDAGAGKWRGSSGTTTTFGAADPHCPTCGRDFATEHRNDDLGEHLAVCLTCLIDTLKAAGIDTTKFAHVDKRGATKAQWDENHRKSKERMAAAAARKGAAANGRSNA